MKKTLLLILICFFFFQFSHAQVDSVYYGNRRKENVKKENNKEPAEDWKKSLIWGGTAQAWFGTQTFIYLSPTVGYPVYKNLILGLGVIYNYSSYKYSNGTYSQSIFGGQSYARYIIRDTYFVQASFDRLLQPNLISAEPNDKIWINYLLVGGGIRYPLSEHAAFTTSLMYYVNPHPLSIYPSRLIFQLGMTASL